MDPGRDARAGLRPAARRPRPQASPSATKRIATPARLHAGRKRRSNLDRLSDIAGLRAERARQAQAAPVGGARSPTATSSSLRALGGVLDKGAQATRSRPRDHPGECHGLRKRLAAPRRPSAKGSKKLALTRDRRAPDMPRRRGGERRRPPATTARPREPARRSTGRGRARSTARAARPRRTARAARPGSRRAARRRGA